jgi:hypothetical protein
MVYHEHFEYFGVVTLNLSHQQSGQGSSERLHNAEEHISTKTRNTLGDKVIAALTEVNLIRHSWSWWAGSCTTRSKRRSCLDCCLINFVEAGLRFFHTRCLILRQKGTCLNTKGQNVGYPPYLFPTQVLPP